MANKRVCSVCRRFPKTAFQKCASLSHSFANWLWVCSCVCASVPVDVSVWVCSLLSRCKGAQRRTFKLLNFFVHCEINVAAHFKWCFEMNILNCCHYSKWTNSSVDQWKEQRLNERRNDVNATQVINTVKLFIFIVTLKVKFLHLVASNLSDLRGAYSH